MENSRTLGFKISMNKTSWLLLLSRLCWVVFICWMMLSHCRCTNEPYDSAPNCPSYYDMYELADMWNMSPRYDVRPTEMTPQGVKVDSSGQTIDRNAIDDLMTRVDQCLYDQFGQGDHLVWSNDIRQKGYCTRASVPYPAPRACVTIKIPDDWYVGCSGQQLLQWKTPSYQPCADKGLDEREGCVCSWRAGVQDGHTIVTVPSFVAFAQWYIEVFYGCFEPWYVDELAKCAGLQI